VDVNGPLSFVLGSDHISESTSAVAVLSESPLQAMPFIAKVSGRPSEKIRASYGFK
jgi:hypothetical protein